MIILDENIYFDQSGVPYVKTRNVGYEEYSYIKSDGSLGICGGFVGPEAGWSAKSFEDQSKEDVAKRLEIERLLVARKLESIKSLLGAK